MEGILRRAASAASLGQCLPHVPRPKRAPPRPDGDRNDGHLDRNERNDVQRTRHYEQHGGTNIGPEEDQSLADHDFLKSEGEEQDAKDTKDTQDTTSRSSGLEPQVRVMQLEFLKCQ